MHDPDAQAESGLTNADRLLLIGALEYKDKRWAPDLGIWALRDCACKFEGCLGLVGATMATTMTMSTLVHAARHAART